MAAEYHVNLVRDALSTPWGFRLQGGRDYKAPLTVSRVNVGSPADSCLRRGDLIVRLENQDARNMTHRQAESIIRSTGGSLFVTLKRGQGLVQPRRERPSTALGRPGPSMLGKVVHSLERNIFTPTAQGNPTGYGNEWEPHRSVRDLKHQFGSRPNVVNVHAYSEPRGIPEQSGYPPWAGSLRNSGGPKQFELAAAQHIAPGSAPGMQQGGPTPYQPAQAGGGYAPVHSRTDNVVTPHQPRLQNLHEGPQGYTYSQHNPDTQPKSDTATAHHLQYNTPIGLYSRRNVDDALRAQTGGRPGEGTIGVSGGGKHEFDPSQSAVLRYLQGEERGQRGWQSARMYEYPDYAQSWMGYQNTRVQSPSMNRLEEQFGVPPSDMQGPGTSDF